MTDHDVSGNDMPNFPWQSRQDARESASLAALLAGTGLPAGSFPELRPVADALAALKAGPASDELAGAAAALAAFRVGLPPHREPSRRRAVLSPLLSARAAAIAVAAALSVGGVATAAYAGALPAPVQRVMHTVFGAPLPAHPGTHPGTPGGSATGARAHTPTPGAGTGSPATHPSPHGSGNTSHPSPTPDGSGKPTSPPSPHGSGKPTTHPSPHGSGKPTTHPSPTGSDKPASQP